jgi:thiol-disulfide isomerase/thioredoxin
MSNMERVPYLEDGDFNPDGSLKPYVNKGKPLVLMVQGSFCGFCTKAKPDFEKFAHSSQKTVGATLQIDGGESEKKAGSRIPKMDSSYRGVPFYMGFNSSGKFVKSHQGGRDTSSIMAFANTLG